MPRPRKTYDKVIQRLAFLSLSDSASAETKATAIVWTATELLGEDRANEIVAAAEELANEANETDDTE